MCKAFTSFLSLTKLTWSKDCGAQESCAYISNTGNCRWLIYIAGNPVLFILCSLVFIGAPAVGIFRNTEIMSSVRFCFAHFLKFAYKRDGNVDQAIYRAGKMTGLVCQLFTTLGNYKYLIYIFAKMPTKNQCFLYSVVWYLFGFYVIEFVCCSQSQVCGGFLALATFLSISLRMHF